MGCPVGEGGGRTLCCPPSYRRSLLNDSDFNGEGVLMNKFNVKRHWLLAAAITGAMVCAPAWAAKDAVNAVGSNFTSLDPYDANDTLSQAVAKSFYQGLFGFDKNMKLENVLADSYTVSKDGLVYTIKLHPGIKFQDGTDFNAAAVKVNFDRASNPDSH